MPAHFKETENSGQGLLLTFDKPEFFVTGIDRTLFLDGFAAHGTLLDKVKGKYLTLCEKELTINYEGVQHTVAASTEVKHAQLGDFGHNEMEDLGSDFILQATGFQIYWSKHDPTNLYFSTGFNPDTSNPTEGIFLIAEIRSGTRYRRGATPINFIIAPDAAPKPETLLVLPSYEIHQIATTQGAASVIPDTIRGRRPLPPQIGDVLLLGNRVEVASVDDLGLSGYESFQHINDIKLISSPTTLYIEDNGGLVYFTQNLLDGSESDPTAWDFLLKIEVYDRAGRAPINMAVTEPIQDLLSDEEDFQILSASNFLGLPTFWHPGGGFVLVSDFENIWVSRRRRLRLLNISHATSLILWDKT